MQIWTAPFAQALRHFCVQHLIVVTIRKFGFSAIVRPFRFNGRRWSGLDRLQRTDLSDGGQANIFVCEVFGGRGEKGDLKYFLPSELLFVENALPHLKFWLFCRSNTDPPNPSPRPPTIFFELKKKKNTIFNFISVP